VDELPEGIARLIRRHEGNVLSMQTALEAELRTYPRHEAVSIKRKILSVLGMVEISMG